MLALSDPSMPLHPSCVASCCRLEQLQSEQMSAACGTLQRTLWARTHLRPSLVRAAVHSGAQSSSSHTRAEFASGGSAASCPPRVGSSGHSAKHARSSKACAHKIIHAPRYQAAPFDECIVSGRSADRACVHSSLLG
jgi:hypothetical protein